jgi:hypothetical protein
LELFYVKRKEFFRPFARKPGRLFGASLQVQIAKAVDCEDLMACAPGGACYMPDVDADYE